MEYQNIEENRRFCFRNLIHLIESYGKLKNHIIFSLVNYERNKEALSKRPHRRYLDMAVIYKIDFGCCADGQFAIDIDNNLQNLWNLSENFLWDLAFENTQRRYPAEWMGVDKLLFSMFARDSDMLSVDLWGMVQALGLVNYEIDPMIVVTNCEKQNGASTILYPGLLEKIHEEIGHDFCLAMSSVHEFIVFTDKRVDINNWRKAIADINNNQVKNEDILSYELFYYNGKKGKLEIIKT